MTDQSEAPSPTLEQLAAEFTVQSPPVQREVSSKEPPKFEKTEEAVEWLAKTVSETEGRLRSLSEEMESKKQQEYVSAQMQALDSAIKTIGKEVDFDPDLIEGYLHTTYNRDKNFQKIFDNRDTNPAAYEKALGVIAGQLKAKATVKHDPQIAENTRALEQLQRSARTGNVQDKDEAARNMSAAEFDRYWASLTTG